ncbi:MAG: prolyl oligopeptidase family serine peptidase [Chloroflexota bacterium]|nr:prolyl oligopeptidase family serine peptidase [Chloroflexota bacterium]
MDQTIPTNSLNYPLSPRGAHVDLLHGQEIGDPYRWLEDADSPESRLWIEEQNKLTTHYLEDIAARPRIQRRLTELWNYEKYGVPFKRGGRYFFTRNDGLQNQSALYWMDTFDAEPQLLLDPNTLSADGTVALTGYAVSDDGRLLAYGLSASGSDWMEWRVREVESGQDRPDHLQWVKFSGAAWTPDSQGFFYSRYDAPEAGTAYKGANYYHKLFYHRINTPQSADLLVHESPEHKEWGFGGEVTDDGRYLVITVWQGTHRENGVLYKDLQEDNTPVVPLLLDFDASYVFVGNDGPRFFFVTDCGAPRLRLICIDIEQPQREHWQAIIGEAEDTLQQVTLVNQTFIAIYLHNAHSLVQLYAMDGALSRSVELPGIGTVSGFGGQADDRETFFSFNSVTTPGVIYHFDVASGTRTVFRAPQLLFDPQQYVSHQVFYTSRDGTRIPMLISHKQGLALNGANPTYLYGYGGFNIPLTPTFSVAIMVWMELGGVFAQANLRGGGEYGKPWHEAGTKLRKQNVFDDFIAAAEWLIAHDYTSTAKLAIGGGSNGGLLVGACMTQRPDLFAACLPAVGVLDMLRFHKFTIGWAWVSDYGSPDDPGEFAALLAYSPYHNIKPGTHYPATLITTGDHDDRVFPAHSFKFAAALQAAQGGPAPILIRIETKAGHGAGKPTSKLIEAAADRWAFLVRVLNMDVT